MHLQERMSSSHQIISLKHVEQHGEHKSDVHYLLNFKALLSFSLLLIFLFSYHRVSDAVCLSMFRYICSIPSLRGLKFYMRIMQQQVVWKLLFGVGLPNLFIIEKELTCSKNSSIGLDGMLNIIERLYNKTIQHKNSSRMLRVIYAVAGNSLDCDISRQQQQINLKLVLINICYQDVRKDKEFLVAECNIHSHYVSCHNNIVDHTLKYWSSHIPLIDIISSIHNLSHRSRKDTFFYAPYYCTVRSIVLS